jgi:hypothetical protein
MNKSIFLIHWNGDPDEGWYHSRAEAEANTPGPNSGIVAVEYVSIERHLGTDLPDNDREVLVRTSYGWKVGYYDNYKNTWYISDSLNKYIPIEWMELPSEMQTGINWNKTYE